MGLPFELWDHVISFLEQDPLSLLACCQTCRRFDSHAKRRLRRLFKPCSIVLDNHASIDLLVEEIRNIPGRARCISSLLLETKDGNCDPVAFCVVPHRLATQLFNLRTLGLSQLHAAPGTHSSTWPLYGRAFPTISHLNLHEVQFASFIDFARFITSFSSLQSVRLEPVSCALPQHRQHLNLVRLSDRLSPIDELVLYDCEDPFVGQIFQWISSRGSATVKNFKTDALHPSSHLLLRSIHATLQSLKLSFVRYRSIQLYSKPVRNFLSKLYLHSIQSHCIISS